MVWARACEIGCALAKCSNSELIRTSGSSESSSNYLLVCAYGPHFSNALQSNSRPYQRGGTSCQHCPNRFNECGDISRPTYSSPPAGFMATEPITNLCCKWPFVLHLIPIICATLNSCCILLCAGCRFFHGAEACIGSDPHFAIRLPRGNLLCYNFQGQLSTTFNLVSNDHLVMNACFIPYDTAWDNTWLGSIAITILHEGIKMITLQFTAANQLVLIGERVQLDARTIKKLSFSKGRLTIIKAASNHTCTYPRVQVEFIDSHLDFTVRFVKNNHLDLYWHSTGEPVKHSKGVVG